MELVEPGHGPAVHMASQIHMAETAREKIRLKMAKPLIEGIHNERHDFAADIKGNASLG